MLIMDILLLTIFRKPAMEVRVQIQLFTSLGPSCSTILNKLCEFLERIRSQFHPDYIKMLPMLPSTKKIKIFKKVMNLY